MGEDKNGAEQLEMTFMPNTIEHLGVRMYSTLPPVIAELVANSYDADSPDVHINLVDNKEDKEIIISDTGHGMSFEDINDKFLKIGRNRRSEKDSQVSPGGRKVIGKKGLGKLSFFGVAREIEIHTCKSEKRNVFVMKWNDILSSPGKYSPNIIEFNRACGKNEHGTTIILRSIQRITDFNAQSLADNLSKIFITDSEFNIYVKHNDDDAIKIENERKYASLTKDVERHVPVDIKLQSEYAKSKDIKGHLIATKTPISPSTKMRGITLFSRRKMINLPEYFSESTSSHFFSYLTGWLEVDFIDDIEEDVIGTNRQSVNREHPDMKVLREYLQQMIRWLEGDRRKKRKEIRVKEVDSKGGVDIKKWRENIPEKIDTHIKQILDTILYDSEASEEQIATVIQNLYAMIPEHPYFHRRYLHPVLKDAAKEKYLKKDYYGAVEQGTLKYIEEIKKKSGVVNAQKETDLISDAFNVKTGILSVVKKFKKSDGSEFDSGVLFHITLGHFYLASAMRGAFRNPIAHVLEAELRDSGLYIEKDCLDALSLLSHLFYRLDNAEIV